MVVCGIGGNGADDHCLVPISLNHLRGRHAGPTDSCPDLVNNIGEDDLGPKKVGLILSDVNNI